MAGKATRTASGYAFHQILYRGWFWVAVCASIAMLATAVAAQEDRPEIMPGERKVAVKKDLGPRALGLLRLSAGGKASLVPIAILINGKFWDATAYKAAPVPMALDPGTVYEVERTGDSLGLFTIGTALHTNAANAPNPWLATGAWVPAGAETRNKPLKAETVPVGLTGDAPPRLTRNPQKEAPPASASPSTPPAAPPAPASGSGDEPPRLTKPKEDTTASTAPNPSAPNAPTGTTGSSQGSTPGTTGSATPAEPKPAEAKPPDRPTEPASDSGATEANRPRLRRGKPTGSLPDEEIPGYSKPGATPPVNTAKTAGATAASEPVQLIPAISDAHGPEPRSYAFTWLKDEEGERRQQMTALAQEQLRAYLQAQAKAQTTAAGAAKSRGSSVQKPPEPVLENVRMMAYDLWTTNQPVMVFSAEAHWPPSAGAQEGIEPGLAYSIVLVAYPDLYNNLHKLYAGVTDKYHLDLTPRLELIDAVDADGDGRGELLFRETSDAGAGWVIYRATADTLWKMFDSLNPE